MLLSDITFLATSVRWTAPPPAWTQTNPNDIRTVNMPVSNGSTQLHLRWTYTLSPGSNLLSTTFSINDGAKDNIGAVFHGSGVTVVNDRNDYRTRFNISGTSEVATLMIFKVTEKGEAVYQCELQTVSSTWSYKIRVIVTGELWIRIDT